MSSDEVCLTRIKYYVQMMLDEENVSLMEPEVLARSVGSFLALSLVGGLWGKGLPDKVVTTDCPATLWDHIKLSLFPRWALQRWPVRFRQWSITGHQVYPDFEVALPGKHHLVVIRGTEMKPEDDQP